MSEGNRFYFSLLISIFILMLLRVFFVFGRCRVVVVFVVWVGLRVGFICVCLRLWCGVCGIFIGFLIVSFIR